VRRLPFHSDGEFEADQIPGTLALTSPNRSAAVQFQLVAAERDIGAFLQRLGNFDTHADLRNIECPGVGELVTAVAIFPHHLNDLGMLGSIVPPRALRSHRPYTYLSAGCG
jgi:hypothetical protein